MTEGTATLGVPVGRRVLVLGAAPEAAAASRELAALGYDVAWAPGAGEHPSRPPDDAAVAVYDGYTLRRLDGHVGDFTAYLDPNGGGGGPTALEVAAVIVATGNRRLFPQSRYGVALGPNVLSVPQARRRLEQPGATGAAAPVRDLRVLVALDLGGETSKETATEALELARDLRARWHSEVYVLYANLKVDTWNLDGLTRAMRDAGIVFCRYENPTLEVTDGAIRFTYVEGTLEGDLLVLPEAVAPREDIAALADVLDVRIGVDGYFQDLNIRQYRVGVASRKGIYFAGRCHMDDDAATLAADALQAAAAVDELLRRGYVEPEETIARVDPDACIRCLTCIRSCPHAAVELAAYQDVTAARVVEVACRGCGACVANCPVQAIEMLGLAVPAWAVRKNGGRLA